MDSKTGTKRATKLSAKKESKRPTKNRVVEAKSPTPLDCSTRFPRKSTKGFQTHPLPSGVLPVYTSRIRPTILSSTEPRSESKEPVMTVSPLAFRGFLRNKVFCVPVSTVVSVSASGSGFINAVLTNATMTATSDFVSLAAIFEEFFISRLDVLWQPVSRYSVLTGGTAGTQEQTIPMGVVSLQHATPTYSSINAIPNHESFQWVNTGDPFKHSWINDESPHDKVLVNDTLTAVATQSWCQSESTPAGAYTGQIQLFSTQSSTAALPFSSVIGYIAARATVLWRQRD